MLFKKSLTLFAFIVLHGLACDGSWMGSIRSYIQNSVCSTMIGECCTEYFTRKSNATTEIQIKLEKQFFGQHIAAETVLAAVQAHMQDRSPRKPLVLSFHGWPGSGKTFLAELLIQSLYTLGVESQYVHMFTGSLHFPNAEKVPEYKRKLQEHLLSALRRCPYSIFVFDEIDVTPPQLFDSLVPFLDHLPVTGVDVDHRKAIYVFLSNVAASEVNKAAFEAWKNGQRREQLSFNDFHSVVSAAAFSSTGTGMTKTRLIDRHLVDYFIPFLPMEKKHVMKCAEVEIARFDAQDVITPEFVSDEMVYWPPDVQLYSQSGCKRVESIVKYHVTRSKWTQSSNSKTEL